MNSTDWPALDVWVFMAQLVEHCNANGGAMGLNPVEVPKFFFQFRVKLQLPLRRSQLHLKIFIDLIIVARP